MILAIGRAERDIGLEFTVEEHFHDVFLRKNSNFDTSKFGNWRDLDIFKKQESVFAAK